MGVIKSLTTIILHPIYTQSLSKPPEKYPKKISEVSSEFNQKISERL
jgi:hypothetical protein